MDEAAQRQYVADNMDSDLQFVMADSGVSLGNQVAVSRHYGSMRRFSAIADDRGTVRTVCLHDFAITQDIPAGRAQVAAVVSAWETARGMIAKEIEIRAEAKILVHLQTHERQAMLRAVETAYGSIPESETPSNDYLSLKAEETGTNEPVASPLDEIVRKKDASNSAIQSTGHIRVTRAKNKTKMPSNTEEYRKAMTVEANAWLCMSSRYRAKFSKFAEYILGDRVYNIQLPSIRGDSAVRVRAEWAIVLAYEYKLRREVMKLIVTDGLSMHDALGQVTRDAGMLTSRNRSSRHHWPYVQRNPLSPPTSSAKVPSRETTRVAEKITKERAKANRSQKPASQNRSLRSSKGCSWLGTHRMVVIFALRGTLVLGRVRAAACISAV